MWRRPWPRTHIQAAMPKVMSKAIVRAIAAGLLVRPGQTASQRAPKRPMPTTMAIVIST